MRIIRERMLFAIHLGQVSGRHAGIIMQNHCLPIAFSHRDSNLLSENGAPDGMHALWKSVADVEEFFRLLGFGEGIESPRPRRDLTNEDPLGWRPNGLFVYVVEYDADGVDSDDEGCPHLSGECGESWLRRPHREELEPMALGLTPWNGVVL